MAKYTQMLERAHEVATGQVTPTTKKRLAVKAEEISRVGDIKAHVAVCTAALMKLVTTLYQLDDDGQPANYDKYTGQILIPVPWGKRGWALWGLRSWEADCLRRILLHRCQHPGKYVQLFDYSHLTRRWYVRADSYPDLEIALAWLKSEGPNAKEWRTELERYYAEQATRKR